MRRIDGLKVSASPFMSNSKQAEVYNFKSAELLPVGAALNFSIAISSGDVEYYLVRMNDQVYLNTTTDKLNVTFTEVSLQVRLFRWNSN